MKKSIIILAAAAMLAAASFAMSVFADDGAGSSSDPIVTKSYVDAAIKDMKEDLETELKQSGSSSSGAVFTAVQIEEGQSVLGGAGTEIILRSGEAKAIDNGSNGVSDLTAGKDIMGGTAISLNHLLLVPREDGRGIKCTTMCWIMVKGSYTVE